MSFPRGLTPEEQAAWAKLAASVTPLADKSAPAAPQVPGTGKTEPQGNPLPTAGIGRGVRPRSLRGPRQAVADTSRVQAGHHAGLDGHWDRKLKAGEIEPDFTLDLHGHTLDSAHTRLMGGMAQARAMDARVVLLIAGRSRPVDPADRGQRRGAIRAKILDWLAASEHGNAIAAIRKAHRRHGGDGALYLVLRRNR